MCAALDAGDGMQLVDDHALHRLQHRAPRGRREQDVQRLGRRHEDVRRHAAHPLALSRGRVAGAHRVADTDVGQPHRDEPGADAGERLLQVLADVVGQRLQRRDVEHVDFVAEALLKTFDHEVIDRRQERGERLAGSGGRGDEGVAMLRRDSPGARLDLGGPAEARSQPAGDGRVELHRCILRPPLGEGWDGGSGRAASFGHRPSGDARLGRATDSSAAGAALQGMQGTTSFDPKRTFVA